MKILNKNIRIKYYMKYYFNLQLNSPWLSLQHKRTLIIDGPVA